jgi:hypothetical protein
MGTVMQAMEDLPAARPVTDDVTPPPPHRWAGSLAVHLLAYVVLLVALMAVGPIGSWTSDDGTYAIQAMTLERTGGWELQHPLEEADPTGAHFSFQGFEQGVEGWYLYVKHPAWIMVLSVAYRLGGPAGLFVPCLLGAVGAAAAAWCVAGLGGRRLSIPAFWLVGLGPIGAQSTALWAHAPSAALAGWATYAAVAIVHRGPSLRRAAGLTVALSAGVLVRSEVPIFAIALLAALGGYGWLRRGEGRSKGMLRAVALPCFAVTAVVMAELRWVAIVAPGAASGLTPRSDNEPIGWVAGRIHGAASSLLLSWLEPGSVLLGLAGVALLVLAGRSLFQESTGQPSGSAEADGAVGEGAPPHRMPSPGMMLAAGGLMVLAVHNVIYLRLPIAGLAPAWPLAVVGLAAWRWTAAPAAERVMAVAAGLFSLAVLATQYAAGGGLDWGGRFFACLAVPLAVLAVGAFDRLSAARVGSGRPVRRPVLIAAVVLGLVLPAGAAVVTTESLRHTHAGIADRVVATDATAVVSLVPAINRLSWRTAPEIRWVTAVDAEDVRVVLDDLARLGERRVLVLGEGITDFDAPGWRSTPAGPGLVVLDRIGD